MIRALSILRISLLLLHVTGCASGSELLGAGGGAGSSSSGEGGAGGGAGGSSSNSSSSSSGGADPCKGVDCTGLDDACHKGTCNPVTHACEATPVADGTPCDDGDACTANDTCAAGVCGGASVCPVGIGLSSTQIGTAKYGNVNGGAAYHDVCPTGQVVIGYSGFLAAGGYHGRIQAICGAVSLSGSDPFAITLSAGATLPLRGLYGNVAWSRTCPAGQMIVGFAGRSGLLVDQLNLRCAPLVVSGAPGSYVISVGATTELAPAGSDSGAPFPQTDCPAGTVATAGEIRAGDSVDAFGLGCSAVSLAY